MAVGMKTWVVLASLLIGFSPVRWAQTTQNDEEVFCPTGCVCRGNRLEPLVDCSKNNLTGIPHPLGSFTTRLDLSVNNISRLPDYAFSHLLYLKDLRLVGNQLTTLPRNVFTGILGLRVLNLDGNLFKTVPYEAFQSLESLQHLHLEGNHIESVHPDSFAQMTHLTNLVLGANNLPEVPIKAVNKATYLMALTLTQNQIRDIPNYAFANMTRLKILLLNQNGIETIHHYAFAKLSALIQLNLNHNKLKELPTAFYSLPELRELGFMGNRIEYLPDYSFGGNQKLTAMQFNGNPIHSVGLHAFDNLPYIKRIILSEAMDQEEFPKFIKTRNIEILGLDRASIKSIPPNMCTHLSRLKSCDVHSNMIEELPDLSACKELRILNLGNNKLNSLEKMPFRGLTQLRDLTLADNLITYIPEDAFAGLSHLSYLDLLHNSIGAIHPLAFVQVVQLEDLNLGENQFSVLPTQGLENLKNLKTFNNKELKDFPSPEAFPKIQYLTLSYAYHCCKFISMEKEKKGSKPQLAEDITWLSSTDYDWSLWRNLTDIFDPLDNSSAPDFANDVYEGFGVDYEVNLPKSAPPSATNYFAEYKPSYDAEDIVIEKPPIECKPLPGPFMPCDDLMGWWWLRCMVWIVCLLALLGNGVVLFVLLMSRTKMDVPRFLICNLACADFIMGIYLGFLAFVDASTLGEFKRYAIKWQTSPGCHAAGFLGVFSSEFSVFTLTVITLERYYAITHAMHLNKRLSLRHAGYIMTGGWFFALIIASLPLFGVSDYRKFAICLPFEIGDVISLGYVCFIMLFNSIAFIIIVSCYLKMYCSIRGSQAWNSNDSRVAKRMALLVFTDFICWTPITFFSLTAAFGKDLISLDGAKVFTIIILPFNSCANPFLYAIYTKQFKKDCTVICKRLEESVMSRNLTRLSTRNPSVTWGSSRRPSALNSFFNIVERRNSRCGASGGTSTPENNSTSTIGKNTVAANNTYLKKCNVEHEMKNYVEGRQVNNMCVCQGCPESCGAQASVGDMSDDPDLRREDHVKQNSQLCQCHSQREVCQNRSHSHCCGKPVISPLFLSILKRHQRRSSKEDSCQDNEQMEHLAPNRCGHFPLMPLGRSPGGARKHKHERSLEQSPEHRARRDHRRHRGRSPLRHSWKRFCSGRQGRSLPASPLSQPHKQNYEVMNPVSDPGYQTTECDPEMCRGDPHAGCSCRDYYMSDAENNNHDYVNITEDMICQLKEIRDQANHDEEQSTCLSYRGHRFHSDGPVCSGACVDIKDGRRVVSDSYGPENWHSETIDDGDPFEESNYVILGPPASKHLHCYPPCVNQSEAGNSDYVPSDDAALCSAAQTPLVGRPQTLDFQPHSSTVVDPTDNYVAMDPIETETEKKVQENPNYLNLPKGLVEDLARQIENNTFREKSHSFSVLKALISPSKYGGRIPSRIQNISEGTSSLPSLSKEEEPQFDFFNDKSTYFALPPLKNSSEPSVSAAQSITAIQQMNMPESGYQSTKEVNSSDNSHQGSYEKQSSALETDTEPNETDHLLIEGAIKLEVLTPRSQRLHDT